MDNIKTIGTYTMDIAAVCNVHIDLNTLDRSVKALIIEVNGPLVFTGGMFSPNTAGFTVAQVGAPAVAATNGTLIVAQKVYNISPLIIAKDASIDFTITNASGAIRMFQIDYIV